MYKYKFFLNKNFMISFITQEIIEENTLVWDLVKKFWENTLIFQNLYSHPPLNGLWHAETAPSTSELGEILVRYVYKITLYTPVYVRCCERKVRKWGVKILWGKFVSVVSGP